MIEKLCLYFLDPRLQLVVFHADEARFDAPTKRRFLIAVLLLDQNLLAQTGDLHVACAMALVPIADAPRKPRRLEALGRRLIGLLGIRRRRPRLGPRRLPAGEAEERAWGY